MINNTIKPDLALMIQKNLIIIGSGPAGLTAAIYAARANLRPVVISGLQPGGQLIQTTEVENYPGFPDGILGPDLMELFKKQAIRFGAESVDSAVEAVDFSQRPFKVKVASTDYTARAVIIATGASSVWLGLPHEQELIGHGVSSCATCDGFFFRGKDVVVIGGGDSAMEEATYLTKFVNSVRVVHRRKELKASKIMQDRAMNDPKISFVWNSEVAEILGEDKLKGLKIKNVETGETTELKTDGLFVAIGYKPNTDIFKGQLELDRKGYVTAGENSQTSVEGVFVAGDVHDYHYRQAVTAAGFGCQAAMDAEKWLSSR